MMKFWRKPVPSVEYRVVEVEKAQRVPEMNEDIARSISTLQSHPGFLYLLAKLKFHRSVLKETVATNRQESQLDTVILQSGVAWSGWLQRELEAAIGFRPAAPVPPGQSELSIFEESQRQLEVLR
jgi:hypothetical protein